MSDPAAGDPQGRESTRLFTRGEVLAGVSARRASALLFLIEYWAAKLQDELRQRNQILVSAHDLAVYAPILMDDSLFHNEKSVENDPNAGYYHAFQLNRSTLPAANLKQIEETAPLWAPIVPDNDRLRAQVARLLLKKYPATENRVPLLRATLELDTEPVRAAYASLYGEPISALYAPGPTGFAARIRSFFGG